MVTVRVPRWGFDYSEARYFGWRHSVHIGPYLVFWGMMADPAPKDELRRFDF